MNKKGFTLIEVIVSVVLVSIVMVTLTSTLVELKKKSETVALNTDAIIYSSVASRVINSDIADNDGVKFIECDPNGEECGIVLGNNSKRTLTIKDQSDTALVKVEAVPGSDNKKFIKKYKTGGQYVDKLDVVLLKNYKVNNCNKTNKYLSANCLAASIGNQYSPSTL